MITIELSIMFSFSKDYIDFSWSRW